MGNIAHISTFSFHGTKNLTTGEGGGALTTNDDAIADRIKILREKGTDKYSFLLIILQEVIMNMLTLATAMCKAIFWELWGG